MGSGFKGIVVNLKLNTVVNLHGSFFHYIEWYDITENFEGFMFVPIVCIWQRVPSLRNELFAVNMAGFARD
jgi:hypothetical protein